MKTNENKMKGRTKSRRRRKKFINILQPKVGLTHQHATRTMHDLYQLEEP